MHPELIKKLRENGLNITPDKMGMNRLESEWCAVGEVVLAGNPVLYASFGDWKKSDQKFSWKNLHSINSHFDLEELEKKMVEQREAAEKDKEMRQEQVALQAQEFWDAIIEPPANEYCQMKNVKMYGVRGSYHELIVPMYDIGGRIWSYQRILADGSKRFLSGGRKKGLYFPLGETCDLATTVYLCEGYATGASIKEAMPEWYVVVCFDAGNLKAVAEEIKWNYPETSIVVCADNDQWGEINTGVEAGAAIPGARVLIPQIEGSPAIPHPTDWNDLHELKGLDEVRRQLKGEAPKDKDKTEEKMPTKRKELIIVRKIQENEAGRLLWEGEDLFFWDKERNHWLHNDKFLAARRLYQIVERGFGATLLHSDITAIVARFKNSIPSIEEGKSFWLPKVKVANFTNKVLEMKRADNKYALVAREHRQDDYSTWTHRFEYREDYSTPNLEFESAVMRTLGCQSLEDAPVKAYFEMLGSCLLPVFPKVCFFLGEPKTGKSTLLLLAKRLVDTSMGVSVDPTKWGGQFGCQSMIGKLVNICTDISENRRISDDILKQIEDRVPIEMGRKFMKAVYSPLPALHLFGANNLPGTTDSLRAYDRRVIILKCDQVVQGETPDRDYWKILWDRGQEGILMRAIEGIKRLAAQGGHYTRVESSVAVLQEWKEKEAGLVERFIQEMHDPEIADKFSVFIAASTESVTGVYLYDKFLVWTEQRQIRAVIPGLKKFYQELRVTKIVTSKKEVGIHVWGFRSTPSGSGDRQNKVSPEVPKY